MWYQDIHTIRKYDSKLLKEDTILYAAAFDANGAFLDIIN